MTLAYAVLFKTHFWDDFVQRQFDRLTRAAGTDEIYVVVDETHGAVGHIPHDKVIRMTEQSSVDNGYLHRPKGNLFWYNTDYQLYAFTDRFPQFEYVVTSEYDCVVGIDIKPMIEKMASEKLDFVGSRIPVPYRTWIWTKPAQTYYGQDAEISGRLLCFSIFSRTLALTLQEARRQLTQRAISEDLTDWPNNEAFVGTELDRRQIREGLMSDFGDTSCYIWGPPFFEEQLPKLPAQAFIHPVLEGSRYIRSILKHKWIIEDIFLPGSYLHDVMKDADLSRVVPPFLQYFLEKRDVSSLQKLREYIESRGGDTRRFFNIARGMPATQSSICGWSRGSTVSKDAGLAVNGIFSGDYAFHTDMDPTPWWCVDLEWCAPIREICIYNRLSLRERARFISVSVAKDPIKWTTIYQQSENKDFGGTDGSPLRLIFDKPMEARFVRIELVGPQILHLEQVEIYI